jgi:hypothetical protein
MNTKAIETENNVERNEELTENETKPEKATQHQSVTAVNNIQAFLHMHSKSETDLLSLIREQASSQTKTTLDVGNIDEQHNKNIQMINNSPTKSTTGCHLTTLNENHILHHDKCQTVSFIPFGGKQNNNYDNNNNFLKSSQHGRHTASSSLSSLPSHFRLPAMKDSRSIPLRLNDDYCEDNNDNDNDDDNIASSHIPTLQHSYSYHSCREEDPNSHFSNHRKQNQHHRAQSQYSFSNNNQKVVHNDDNNNNNNDVFSNSHQPYLALSETNDNGHAISSNHVEQNVSLETNLNTNMDHELTKQLSQTKNGNDNYHENTNDKNIIDGTNNVNENANQQNNQLNVNFPFPAPTIPNWQQSQQMFLFGQMNNSQSNISLLENSSIPQDLLISIGNNNNNNNNGNLGPLSNVTTPIVTPTNHNLRPMTPPSSSLGLAQTPQLRNNSNWTFANINGRIVPIPKIQNNNNMNNNNNAHNNDNNAYFHRNNNIPYQHQYQLPFNNNNNNINNNTAMFATMSQAGSSITLPTANIRPSLTTLYNMNNQMQYPSNFY